MASEFPQEPDSPPGFANADELKAHFIKQNAKQHWEGFIKHLAKCLKEDPELKNVVDGLDEEDILEIVENFVKDVNIDDKVFKDTLIEVINGKYD